MIRYALVRSARSCTEAARYLPDNYRVIHGAIAEDGRRTVYVIAGEDSHGWTLDGYVIPRYASGLIACEEIDLSHPIMKGVPVESLTS